VTTPVFDCPAGLFFASTDSAGKKVLESLACCSERICGNQASDLFPHCTTRSAGKNSQRATGLPRDAKLETALTEKFRPVSKIGQSGSFKKALDAHWKPGPPQGQNVCRMSPLISREVPITRWRWQSCDCGGLSEMDWKRLSARRFFPPSWASPCGAFGKRRQGGSRIQKIYH